MREGLFKRPEVGGNFRSDPAALAAFEQPGADGLGPNNGLHLVKPVPTFAKASRLLKSSLIP